MSVCPSPFGSPSGSPFESPFRSLAITLYTRRNSTTTCTVGSRLPFGISNPLTLVRSMSAVGRLLGCCRRLRSLGRRLGLGIIFLILSIPASRAPFITLYARSPVSFASFCSFTASFCSFTILAGARDFFFSSFGSGVVASVAGAGGLLSSGSSSSFGKVVKLGSKECSLPSKVGSMANFHFTKSALSSNSKYRWLSLSCILMTFSSSIISTRESLSTYCPRSP
mmetsp:Transcript_1797/g.4049  ORF Transcript_1797/g.4049 Transcript_1797/m.4049 type:complete len:224 (+) Transcript_1797:187-858(+)